MEPLKSFTALDFETFTPERSSACAVGLVKVKDGHIIHKFYSLINPIPDDRTSDNSAVHGITAEMISQAPTFADLWPLIKGIIGDDSIVSHNSDFDEGVWKTQLSHYSLDTPGRYKFVCTFKMTGLSLEACCEKHNIDMGTHHDALDDAIACAKVMLAEAGHLQTSKFTGGVAQALEQMAAKKYDRSTLDPLADEEIEDKSTPFFHAKTVITGTFEAYPNRNELGKMLQSLGADINTSISKKTNVVVMGKGAGPSKMKKIEELQATGCDIRIIYEPELIAILEHRASNNTIEQPNSTDDIASLKLKAADHQTSEFIKSLGSDSKW